MDSQKKQEVIDYIKQRIERGDVRTKGYILNAQGCKNPNRNCFLVLKKYLDDYRGKRGKDPARFLVLYGLRGTGKTTLLSQMYGEIQNVPKEYKLFLSVDEIINLLGVTLKDVLDMYEEVLGSSFEGLSQPVFLFLDEVHFDGTWAVLLKTVYDRTKNVFIIATGSSALSLQTTPDTARRAVSIKLYPMQFTEYIKIRDGKYEEKGLARELRDIIFDSHSASEVYNSLQDVKPRVQKYWSGLKREDIENYLGYGTFPFTAVSLSDTVAYDQIKKTLERVISIDIPHVENFSPEIISKIPSVLYTLASTEQCNFTSLSKSVGMNRHTLTSILETLEKTETVWRLYPYGQHHTQVRKPSKYLFTSPAFRSMYFSLAESISQHDNFKGKVLEDAIGLSLRRLFSKSPRFSVTYDSSEGGADFIVCKEKKVFVLEVGYGHKKIDQIIQTMGRIHRETSYGILVSQNLLAIHHDENIVEVPISYFLLL